MKGIRAAILAVCHFGSEGTVVHGKIRRARGARQGVDGTRDAEEGVEQAKRAPPLGVEITASQELRPYLQRLAQQLAQRETTGGAVSVLTFTETGTASDQESTCRYQLAIVIEAELLRLGFLSEDEASLGTQTLLQERVAADFEHLREHVAVELGMQWPVKDANELRHESYTPICGLPDTQAVALPHSHSHASARAHSRQHTAEPSM
jgi:hypothetical protein